MAIFIVLLQRGIVQDLYSHTQSGEKMLSRHHGKTRPGLTKGEEE